ncbi:thioredoxin family protein [Winogradskyella algicola]|uniref:thioredoxin family protein n=1 Tax=Winogradskyella algicola TaxID=2575815 RepID=UPI0011081A5E|nr:thioredoxin family protein [Winogradskyella algicola]
MKTNIFSLLIISFISIQINAQNLNTEITENTDTPYLLGKIDKSGLESDNYKSWFTKNYNDYEPNSTIIEAIASELKNYSITLFMGTWCGDSKKEVPRLYKVLEACNYPMDQLTVVAVSREAGMYKQSPQHEEEGLNIHRVPTVIFYKDGKEINRIVEHPVKTFEEDIQNIITVNDYKSNYQIVAIVDDILSKKGTKGLKRKQKNLLKKYKGKVSSMFELNTYGKILFNTNRIEEVIAVFELNTKLFPDEPRTYMSLANTLGFSGQKEKAIEVLENAVELFPDNNNLKQNLEVIKSN